MRTSIAFALSLAVVLLIACDSSSRRWSAIPAVGKAQPAVLPQDRPVAIRLTQGGMCFRFADGTVGHARLAGGGNRHVLIKPWRSERAPLDFACEYLCLLDDAGAVRCGDYEAPTFLREMMVVPSARRVAAGEQTVCAITREGDAQCTDGTNAAKASAAEVAELRTLGPIERLLPGARCAILSDRSLACASPPRLLMRDVFDASVSVGRDAHDIFGCAVLDDRTVSCFGTNDEGQIGDGTHAYHTNPTPVPGLTLVRSVEVSPAHACALTESGDVYCWGRTRYGETGPEAEAVGAHEVNVCLVDKEATAKARAELARRMDCPRSRGDHDDLCGRQRWHWERAGSPQPVIYRHDGSCVDPNISSTEFVTHPVRVAGVTEAVSLTVGNEASCALRRDGVVICWGMWERDPFVLRFPARDRL